MLPDRSTLARRIALAATALVGIALAGGGLAATSAAWTDAVYVSAAGTAGTADLEGSLDGSAWRQSSDADAVELVIPPITGLTPADDLVRTFLIRNTGTVPVLIDPGITTSGTLFAGPAPASAIFDPGFALSIAAGETATGRIRISTPGWTGSEYQGATGTITVSIRGTVA